MSDSQLSSQMILTIVVALLIVSFICYDKYNKQYAYHHFAKKEKVKEQYDMLTYAVASGATKDATCIVC